MLCVAAMSFHSLFTAVMPRRAKRLMPRFVLGLAEHGLDRRASLLVEPSTAGRRELRSHRDRWCRWQRASPRQQELIDAGSTDPQLVRSIEDGDLAAFHAGEHFGSSGFSTNVPLDAVGFCPAR
jgi:hypothetical protein